MKTLQIEESKAKELYKTASDEFKIMLEDSFGKAFFNNNWMELWEKFCRENKLTLALPYPNPASSDEEYIDAQFMMMHIIRKRRKKKPDFNNSNEYKYYPVFDMRSCSGFGFSNSSTFIWCTHANVGSRLCIPDDDKMIQALAVEFLPRMETFRKPKRKTGRK